MSDRIWNRPWQSCFDQAFDVAVVGTGYAGYAAVRALEAAGRSALLIDRGSDLLWESGRAMVCDAGASDHPLWHELVTDLHARGAASADELDGPAAEVVASHKLLEGETRVLYYAAPVDIEIDNGQITGLIVATRAGLRRIVARQWIDATETAELLALLDARLDRTTPRRTPARQRICIALQRHDWPGDTPTHIESPHALKATTLAFEPTLWSNQRVLRIDVPGEFDLADRWPETIGAALQALHATIPETIQQAPVSHMSLMPLGLFDGDAPSDAPTPDDITNLALASPAACDAPARTLAERFDLGIAAAAKLDTLDAAQPALGAPSRPIEPVRSTHTLSADVVVAGGGTGGALAAVAAGRSGADVLCIEPMAFPGGIGAGGGIHSYYFGIPGGLQAELDQRVKQKMAHFGSMAQVKGFHPEAKKLVLLEMMREAGVRFCPFTTAFAAHTEHRRVTHVLAAAPDGPVKLEARGWIDATGDGDLCALAGAAFARGRVGDGLLHAYSQSAGRLSLQEHQQQTFIHTGATNFDAGWVDPTDSEDLTRGRLVGICQYMREDHGPLERETYIAPAIGLRQGRQVQAAYMLTLADLIERRHFPDVIGFTGANYDNHAVDYEFESDEAMFWVWLCRQWRAAIASEMPYRMIVPRDLDNVWIGSRALGVTQDAHHCCRMQRDMQRVGEAAGYAATLAIEHDVEALGIPVETLQRKLTETGAMKLERVRADGPWDLRLVDLALLAAPEEPADPEAVNEGLEKLAQGIPHRALWHLYRSPGHAGEKVRGHLQSDDPHVSWLAAGICAMWGEPEAEPRLLEAIRTREYGYDDRTDEHMARLPGKKDAARPEGNPALVPNWLAAVSLLRRCGTRDALPVLLELAREPELLLNARTGIAVTTERLIRDQRVRDDELAIVRELIDALLRDRALGSFATPRRRMGQILQEKVIDLNDPEPADRPSAQPEGVTRPQHSLLWQLHLVVARLCRLTDTRPPELIDSYRHDHRRCVRLAFEAAFKGEEPAPQPTAEALPAD